MIRTMGLLFTVWVICLGGLSKAEENGIVYEIIEQLNTNSLIYIQPNKDLKRILGYESHLDILGSREDDGDLSAPKEHYFIAEKPFQTPFCCLEFKVFVRNIRNIQGNLFIYKIDKAEITREDKERAFDWCSQGSDYGSLAAFVAVRYRNSTRNSSLDLKIFKCKGYYLPQASQQYFERPMNLNETLKRCMVFNDPPSVFMQDNTYNNLTTKGYGVSMIHNFLLRNGFKCNRVQAQDNTLDAVATVRKFAQAGAVNIVVTPSMPISGIRLSYPFKMMKWCVMVPLGKEIPYFKYFIRPFKYTMWSACIGSLFATTLLKFLTFRYCNVKRHLAEFGKIFIQTFSYMLYLPACSESIIKKYRLSTMAFHLLEWAFGFILSNLYLAILTSYLALKIFEPRLETLRDMVDRNLTIFVIEKEFINIFDRQSEPAGFSDLLRAKKKAELFEYITNFETDKAYLLSDEITDLILIQQQQLYQNFYYIANECVMTVPVGFLFSDTPHFEHLLNSFILNTVNSGLFDKWFKKSIDDTVRAGLLKIKPSITLTQTALQIKHFEFASLSLLGGLSTAFMVFCLENMQRIVQFLKPLKGIFKHFIRNHKKIIRKQYSKGEIN